MTPSEMNDIVLKTALSKNRNLICLLDAISNNLKLSDTKTLSTQDLINLLHSFAIAGYHNYSLLLRF